MNRKQAENLIDQRLSRPRRLQRAALALGMAGALVAGVSENPNAGWSGLALLAAGTGVQAVGIRSQNRSRMDCDTIVRTYAAVNNLPFTPSGQTTVSTDAQGNLSEKRMRDPTSDPDAVRTMPQDWFSIFSPSFVWTGTSMALKIGSNQALETGARNAGLSLALSVFVTGAMIQGFTCEWGTKEDASAYKRQLANIENGLNFQLPGTN